MSTTDPDADCPALHVLNGALGEGRWPEHAPDEYGVALSTAAAVDEVTT